MTKFGKQQLHELYYYLKLNRSLEEELVRLFRAGKLVGPLPISTGQEALGLGAAYPLDAGDFFSSAIPSSGALLARGVRLDRLSAQGYGEEHPVASNETEAGRARNRRIEFTALD